MFIYEIVFDLFKVVKWWTQNDLIIFKECVYFSDLRRNVLDLAAVGVIKKYSHLPIIVDPSHATGQRYLIEPMSKAAIVAGADGLMVEIHNNPDKAYSDGAQSLTIPQFKNLMTHLSALIKVLDESKDLIVV